MTCRSSTILVQILSDPFFLFLIGATLNRAGWHWRPLDFTGMQGCGAAAVWSFPMPTSMPWSRKYGSRACGAGRSDGLDPSRKYSDRLSIGGWAMEGG